MCMIVIFRASPRDRIGDALYNRGILNAMYIAEGIRTAQEVTGNSKDYRGRYAPGAGKHEHHSGSPRRNGDGWIHCAFADNV